MDANFDACMAVLLKNEGGYVNNPNDSGGPTNMGITQATLSNWRGKPQTADDVRALTQAEATDIYRANYWNASGCPQWPVGVDLFVFDGAVNIDPGGAVRFLQNAAGVAVDGAIGPNTRSAVQQAKPADLVNRMATFRSAYYKTRPGFPYFGDGWLKRNERTRQDALAMMGGTA